jgi:transcriptional regulator with XRE-family HTH domain
MDFAQQLGKRIRRARMECGMTQGELASEARVGANYVPRLERGELVPSVEAAFRIAKALGMSLDELCGRAMVRKDVQEVIARLDRADAIALRKVADVIDALLGPGRRLTGVSVKKPKSG